MAATKLTIIRHGETEWNLAGIQQGHLDSPLTTRGLAQAEALADHFDGYRFDAIYSSDLGRALRTGEIIASKFGVRPATRECLRERNLGIMQGLTMKESREKYPEEYAHFSAGDPSYVLPKGESVVQRHERVISCLSGLIEAHPGQDILVVAHGGVLDSVIRHIFHIPLGVKRPFSLLNSSINVISAGENGWRLLTWGSVVHLKGGAVLDDA
jgi:probable phosphoglycerate mutase